MNCKPGDIARCIVSGDWYGALFSVIESAPVDVQFSLPDGLQHQPTGPDRWIVESLGSKVPTNKWTAGVPTPITVRYGVIRDTLLRPIRDEPGADETLAWAGKPAELERAGQQRLIA